MDARQRLLNALAEVERLAGVENEAVRLDSRDRATGTYIPWHVSRLATHRALHALLPTLAALREVVEEHKIGTGGLCRACSYIDDEDCVEGEEYPCHTLRTLTRQFEED